MLVKHITTRKEVSVTDVIQEITEAAVSSNKVEEHTHGFYKYPACFHPKVVRSLIRHFSKPGDVVLDPFVGGGTSAVEALLLGRNFIGVDLNDLALFAGKLKTTLLTASDVSELDVWVNDVARLTLKDPQGKVTAEERKYFLTISDDLALTIKNALLMSDDLTPRARLFARGVIANCSKTAIDNRKNHPDSVSFIISVQGKYEEMVERALTFAARVQGLKEQYNLREKPNARFVSSSTSDEGLPKKVNQTVDLVVTSPPYPGISVLYNRWQVHGRKETQLPYWIIGSRQRESASFLTMGHPKSDQGIDQYFETIRGSFQNVSSLLKPGGLTIQIVAFSDRRTQLPRYVQTMKEVGLSEIKNISPSSYDGRIWRSVPNRKWYNNLQSSKVSERKEVILFFRKS